MNIKYKMIPGTIKERLLELIIFEAIIDSQYSLYFAIKIDEKGTIIAGTRMSDEDKINLFNSKYKISDINNDFLKYIESYYGLKNLFPDAGGNI